ncbi:acyl-CoA thioester hydrolase/BAAT C-terminal domain-containing protein [Halorussus aquaticus]|uniref:Acyl-CoA thioester hydrolase/BAAT C-terminal domain-containing protein n=1 Tax=Halorussus aquaticus TaxID=2953748 RepID=A0ABD5PWY7_9EURY|nr:acyl-CoA thioester hydrolase/BAAT C-terminal domain-containing protein [Halorussus aquaticus]
MTKTRRDLLRAVAVSGGVTLAPGTLATGERGPNPEVRAPDRTLVGRPARVRLAGFAPRTEVTLEATATDERGVEFSAARSLRTDRTGAASVADRLSSATTDPAGTADWTAMGPGFESSDLAAVEMLLCRLTPRAGASPTPDRFVAGERAAVDVTLTARVGEERRASATTTRVLTDSSVSRRTVSDRDLVGWLYEPPGKAEGPHQGVVALHGSHARVPHALSRTLASHGYATLALQYVGGEGLPESVRGVPVEYFRRATRWLTERERVRDERAGFVGVSRGVEAALLAAADFSGSTAVVGYSGGGVLGPGVNASATAVTDWASAWTRNGDPLADATAVRTVFSAVQDAREECETVACVPESVREWVGASTLRRAVAPVEIIDGPVVLLAGSDDATWPAPALSAMAIDRLDRRGHDQPYQLRVYDDAGHVFGLPYRRYTGEATSQEYGGSPAANAVAAADSWPVVLRYLRRGLRPESDSTALV